MAVVKIVGPIRSAEFWAHALHCTLQLPPQVCIWVYFIDQQSNVRNRSTTSEPLTGGIVPASTRFACTILSGLSGGRPPAQWARLRMDALVHIALHAYVTPDEFTSTRSIDLGTVDSPDDHLTLLKRAIEMMFR